MHWLEGQSRWQCPWILSAIACLLNYRLFPCQRFLPHHLLLCTAWMFCWKWEERKHEAENQATDLWKGQSIGPCKVRAGCEGGDKTLSEKNYFLEKTNKTPLVAVRSAGLYTALPWAPAPALLAVSHQGLLGSILNPVFPF